jgi:peptidoglycan hydrolase CwlO-like protein
MMGRKKGSTSTSSNQPSELDKKLVENLVALQKVNVDLALKFDSLSKQISELLNLFESAARSFAKNPANLVTEKDKEFLDKIDRLLDQNKTIAKGLTMVEERMRDKMQIPRQSSSSSSLEDQGMQPSINRPLPKF